MNAKTVGQKAGRHGGCAARPRGTWIVTRPLASDAAHASTVKYEARCASCGAVDAFEEDYGVLSDIFSLPARRRMS